MSWQEAVVRGEVSSMHRLIDMCWGTSPPAVALWPHRIDYRDELNSGFQLDALCLSQSSTVELKSLLGRPVAFGLMTAQGKRRWLCGIISRVQMLGDEAGFSLIGLRVEPALSLLAQRLTSRIFQDKSAPDIVAAVLDEHCQRNPQIGISFDHALQLQGNYAPRSYCVQFNESDHAFINRLLAEEGITYRYAFDAEDGVPKHQLILSDTPLPAGAISRQLHHRAQAGVVALEESTLTGWQSQRRLIGASVALASYDYRPAQALQGWDNSIQQQGDAGMQAASTLSEYSAQTLYYGDNNSDMDRYARLRMQAQELRAKTFFGSGRLRGLATGDGFVLEDHPNHAADDRERRSFVVTGLHLRADNNLPEAWSVPSALLTRSHALAGETVGAPDVFDADDSTEAGAYRTRFSAVRRDIPLVPAYAGALAKPTAHGPQTAMVVGPQGEEVYTDELGRIFIQPFWQRSQEHPNGTAEFNERSSTAVRVTMPSAGEGFGHQFVPRIGQEVLVDFLFGDIDRPVVIGALYNGRHPPPDFSGATGLPGNRTLSGIRSREHHGSGYSELLMDDTPGQVRVRLAATPHATELNMGRLTTPRKDGQAQPRGDGAELRSDAAIAVRAATGLLLSTYARRMAQGAQLDSQELMDLLDDCFDLFSGLARTAAARGAQANDEDALERLRDALAGWPEEGADGKPVMALVAEAGMVVATPQAQLHYAGTNHDVVAADHVQSTSGGATRVQAGMGISLFAQDEGLKAIANRGQVLVQAQDDDVAINAQKTTHVSASEGEVLITAPTIRLVADDGSYIRIGEGIELGTNGAVKMHGASHDWLGPKTDSFEIPGFGRDAADQQFLFHYPGHSEQTPMLAVGHAYRMVLEDGSEVEGVTNASGVAEMVARDSMQRVQISALREEPSADRSVVPMLAPSVAGKHDEQFRLVSEGDESVPLAGRKYRVVGDNGQQWEGVTDADGLTQRIHTDRAVSLTLEVLDSAEGVTIT